MWCTVAFSVTSDLKFVAQVTRTSHPPLYKHVHVASAVIDYMWELGSLY